MSLPLSKPEFHLAFVNLLSRLSYAYRIFYVMLYAICYNKHTQINSLQTSLFAFIE